MLKNELAKAFGSVIRKHRSRKKMTNEKLSERADLDVKMIYMVERAIRKPL